MNKGELIQSVQDSLGDEATKACAERAVEAVLDAIKSGIQNDGNVTLIGFGTFSVSERPARDGINPKTREKIRIAASKVVKFKVGSALKQSVQ